MQKISMRDGKKKLRGREKGRKEGREGGRQIERERGGGG